MSSKRNSYSTEFKTKIILEHLSGATINSLASKYQVSPTNIQKRKSIFLRNVSSVFDSSINKKDEHYQKIIDDLTNQIGQLTIQLNRFKKKAGSIPYYQRLNLIDKSHSDLSIRKQCELLQVSKSSLYYDRSLSPSDKQILDLIDYIYTNNPTYGKRRISAIIKADYNLNVGVKKVRKFMNILGLEPIYPKPKTSIKNSQHKIFPYLLKDIEINRVGQVYGTDTTYIKTKFGRLYLTVLLDWYPKFIVSFALSFSLERFAVIQTIHIASKILLPDIINSDQGSQFTSTDYTETVLNYGIKLFMDGKGSYFDNIFTERLWRTIKTEEVYLSTMNSNRRSKFHNQLYCQI